MFLPYPDAGFCTLTLRDLAEVESLGFPHEARQERGRNLNLGRRSFGIVGEQQQRLRGSGPPYATGVHRNAQHAFAAGRDHLLEHFPFRAVTFRDHLRDDKVGFSPIVYSNEILCDRITLDSAKIEVLRFDFDDGCIRR